METPRKNTSHALALVFLSAAVGSFGHFVGTITSQSKMSDAAIEAGYSVMDTKPDDERNGGVMITTRGLFSTAAVVEAYFVDQAKNQKLCKYEGATYQLFGQPLFSTTKSLSCAPVAPWPELSPKP